MTDTTTEPHAPVVTLPATMPAALVRAVCNVMTELPAIGKAERSPEGYNYRGIESITKHAQVLMAKHGIMILPSTSVVSVEPSPFMKDGWQDVYVTCDWTIYGPDGVGVTARTVGIGRDKADKGSNKGQTQAFKYLLLTLFCVADKADDSDGVTYEDERGHATQPRGRGQRTTTTAQQRRTAAAASDGYGTEAPEPDTTEAPSDDPPAFNWNGIGWTDKAEHDAAMYKCTGRTAELDGLHPGFRDVVAARWRSEGMKLPLSFDAMSAWASWLETACVQYVAAKVAAVTDAAPDEPKAKVGARAKTRTPSVPDPDMADVAGENEPEEHDTTGLDA